MAGSADGRRNRFIHFQVGPQCHFGPATKPQYRTGVQGTKRRTCCRSVGHGRKAPTTDDRFAPSAKQFTATKISSTVIGYDKSLDKTIAKSDIMPRPTKRSTRFSGMTLSSSVNPAQASKMAAGDDRQVASVQTAEQTEMRRPERSAFSTFPVFCVWG
jgi:hypothetical protein